MNDEILYRECPRCKGKGFTSIDRDYGEALLAGALFLLKEFRSDCNCEDRLPISSVTMRDLLIKNIQKELDERIKWRRTHERRSFR